MWPKNTGAELALKSLGANLAIHIYCSYHIITGGVAEVVTAGRVAELVPKEGLAE